MKKAVIQTGGKQYLVQEGETLRIELLKAEGKKVSFEPMLIIDGESVSVGTPLVPKISVTAEVIDEDIQADKVVGVRFKAKKRVHTVHGHRQHQTMLKIISIA